MKVAVVGTGGTIASTTRKDRDIAYPEVEVSDLIKAAGPAQADVVAIDLLHEGSNALTLEHVAQVAEAVRKLFADGMDAVVITQGTATLSETSYMYDLLLGDCPPVVCTGAMRPVSDLSPDGPINLRDSLLFALASADSRRGVYVVMDGAVHAPVDVLKVDGARSAAFASPGVGVLGWIDAEEVRIRRERRVRTDVFPGLDPGVELLTATLDAGPVLVDCVADSGDVTGLVIAGFPGRGAVPPQWLDPIERYLKSGRPMVFSTHSLGRVLPKHGEKATARHLRDMGAIMGGDLAPVKARCLLMAILSRTRQPSEVEDLVAEELSWY